MCIHILQTTGLQHALYDIIACDTGYPRFALALAEQLPKSW